MKMKNVNPNRQPDSKSKKDKLLDSLKLPGDVLRGEMRVTFTGNREAFVENYKGILEYTSETILLQGKKNQVCFTGSRLSIDYYTNEDMKVSGCIDQVKFI